MAKLAKRKLNWVQEYSGLHPIYQITFWCFWAVCWGSCSPKGPMHVVFLVLQVWLAMWNVYILGTIKGRRDAVQLYQPALNDLHDLVNKIADAKDY